MERNSQIVNIANNRAIERGGEYKSITWRTPQQLISSLCTHQADTHEAQRRTVPAINIGNAMGRKCDNGHA
jgi:hypothetical protein